MIHRSGPLFWALPSNSARGIVILSQGFLGEGAESYGSPDKDLPRLPRRLLNPNLRPQKEGIMTESKQARATDRALVSDEKGEVETIHKHFPN